MNKNKITHSKLCGTRVNSIQNDFEQGPTLLYYLCFVQELKNTGEKISHPLLQIY